MTLLLQCVIVVFAISQARVVVVAWKPPLPFHRPTTTTTATTTQLATTTVAPFVKTEEQLLLRLDPTRSNHIAQSFTPGSFDPLILGGHAQSILGFFLRDSCGYVPRGNMFALLQQAFAAAFTASSSSAKSQESPSSSSYWSWDTRERIETPDGDWFHADTKYCSTGSRRAVDLKEEAQRPTVILLHGLCSSSNSSLARDLGRAFTSQGMDCVCLNFRGCSGSMNDKLGGYHLGFTDDLHYYLQKRHSSSSASSGPVFLAGYSLGANVVLKCLGELGGDAVEKYNIAGAVALCAPLEQTKNAAVLAQRDSLFHRVYTQNLLTTLKPMAQQQLRYFCNDNPDTTHFDFRGVLQAETITDFDEAFIAPVYGFQDAADYYRRTSSIHFLDKIVVPTLILNAEDDPFLDASVWPAEQYCCTRTSAAGSSSTCSSINPPPPPPPPIRMVRTLHGGHLGFCFHQVDETDPRLVTRNNHVLGGQQQQSSSSSSWASSEAANFVNHVYNCLYKD